MDHYIGGFDISMYYTSFVDGFQTDCELPSDGDDVLLF